MTKKPAAAVDLGGTEIKLGIVGPDYSLLDSLTLPTPKCRGAERDTEKDTEKDTKRDSEIDAEEVADAICRGLQRLFEKNGLDLCGVSGVGVSCPGIIDARDGTVLYSNNFGWENVSLTGLLARRLSLPMTIRNDAVCAGMAEWKAGNGMGCADLLLLTLGTGVGSCVIVGGKPLDGAGGGGIAGHVVIDRRGRQCNCGKRGCLEAYASARALAVTARAEMRRVRSGALWDLCAGDGRRIDAKTVFDAAEKGDGAARAALESYTDALALGIGCLTDLLRPDIVLLGGGVSRAGERLLSPVREKVPRYVYGGASRPLPRIETARFRNMAGMIGAAALVFDGEDDRSANG